MVLARDWHDLHIPYALAQSAVAVPLTGSTTETTLATITVAAGAMGPNGILRVTTLWTWPNSANNKTPRVRFGGTAFFSAAQTTTTGIQSITMIRNRGAQNSQVASALTSAGTGTTTGAVATGSVDTSVAQDLTITGQLALGTETITLESYSVELIAG